MHNLSKVDTSRGRAILDQLWLKNIMMVCILLSLRNANLDSMKDKKMTMLPAK
jgi:hypothetical protein